MAAADVAAGRLHSLFGRPVAAPGGYHLVYPPALAGDRRLRNIRGWLLAEAGRFTTPRA
ncbi:hypothetical protein [Zavarzinia compransoris]|uniref:hypothetical protein n=1 Tax=Zavarzinia compransoris TaxID=1264899 RepID=UPI0010E8EA20|nr:hypothetical protein [Zavarzinia compransoris]TDP46248.1 hypothetical protein DES42_104334 [Zavarzinia compransoris]